MGLDRSVLRSEMSFGHFGIGAEVPGHFGRISAEVSQCRTVSGHNCPVKAKFHYTDPTRTRHGPDTDKVRARCRVRAKFHYTDPTGPTRTQRSFAAKKVRAGPVGSVSGPCSGI